MKRNNLLILLLTIITLAYYFPIVNLPMSPMDEPFLLVGAERVLNGQIPHKDFSSEYPVGQLYTLAALFKVFGTSSITARVYDLLTKSFISLSIFIIIRLLSSNIPALAGWAMSLAWIQYSTSPSYPAYQSLLFIYISIYWLLLHMKEQKNHYVVLSGIFIAIATLFRHDFGVYAAFAIAIVLIFRSITKVQSWSPAVLFIASGVLTGLPVIGYLLTNADIQSILTDLYLIPVAMLDNQALPYPPLTRWNLPFYVFPFVLLTGFITSIILIKCKRDATRAYAILFISLIGILCLNQVKMRSDKIHLLPAALTAILLAPVLLHTLLMELSLNKWQKRVVYVLFVIVFGVTLSKPVEAINSILSNTNWYMVKNVNPDIERAKNLNLNADLKDTVAYIKNNTSKNENIYVGVKNHDRFVFNDAIVYFLAERNCASRYHVLSPGVQTTMKVQKEMINEFKNNPPKLIVLALRSSNEPNPSSVDSRIDFLDNYISTNFALRKTFGIYEIWMK